MNSAPQLAFVHIPKNAGTSIACAIAEQGLPILSSDHSYPAKIGDEEIVVFRCPFDRFVSAFHYGKRRWPNPVNANFESANELAVSASDPSDAKHALAWIEFGNRPADFLLRNGRPIPPHTVAGRVLSRNWVYEPQTAWLIHHPAHVLRYSHLAEDFSRLLRSRGLQEITDLPRLNEGADGRREVLSPQARAFLYGFYADDFAFMRERGMDA